MYTQQGLEKHMQKGDFDDEGNIYFFHPYCNVTISPLFVLALTNLSSFIISSAWSISTMKKRLCVIFLTISLVSSVDQNTNTSTTRTTNNSRSTLNFLIISAKTNNALRNVSQSSRQHPNWTYITPKCIILIQDTANSL